MKTLLIHDLYDHKWYTAIDDGKSEQIHLHSADGSSRIMNRWYFETYIKDNNIEVTEK